MITSFARWQLLLQGEDNKLFVAKYQKNHSINYFFQIWISKNFFFMERSSIIFPPTPECSGYSTACDGDTE